MGAWPVAAAALPPSNCRMATAQGLRTAGTSVTKQFNKYKMFVIDRFSSAKTYPIYCQEALKPGH
jgi:hypothetical protein